MLKIICLVNATRSQSKHGSLLVIVDDGAVMIMRILIATMAHGHDTSIKGEAWRASDGS